MLEPPLEKDKGKWPLNKYFETTPQNSEEDSCEI